MTSSNMTRQIRMTRMSDGPESGTVLVGCKSHAIQVCKLTAITDGGLLGWITIGVNTKDNHVPQPPNSKRSVIDWHLE